MARIDFDLGNLDQAFPSDFSPAELARGKTFFLKKLALEAHRFYGGKIQVLPKAGVYGFNWFGVYYSPGVSAVSTAIRDRNDESLELSNRGGTVAVVSDSTRVLGDGDCTPPGGMGVMEGKAFLMKYLGGVDAVPLCIDSRGPDGRNDPARVIEFVKMCQHSFGAVNLEDISQPNCFRVLDELRESCGIPVWHDDAQGTACVTLAGVINALKLAGKEIANTRIVMLGAGASMTTIARLLIADGADPERLVLFDSKGSLHSGRADIQADPRFYRKWELCLSTNPERFASEEEALRGADVLLGASTPGPDTVKPAWIRGMAPKSIVFACANPVPEIYPYAAKEAGAFIVGTGRSDFPNQVNNSVCFPGLLKGTLLCRASKISDGMAIRAAHSIAAFAERGGIHPERVMPSMDEEGVFYEQAADVAEQAAAEGLARVKVSHEEVRLRAKADIEESRALTRRLMEEGFIKRPPESMLEACLDWAIDQARAGR
jgi:malate dehydrogenase (oxaloacetate-decarboxylating)